MTTNLHRFGHLARGAVAAAAAVAIGLATVPPASAAARPAAATGSGAVKWKCAFGGDYNIEKKLSNKITPRSKKTGKGTVDLRAGWYKGKQYGWARVRSPKSTKQFTMIEVDTNGDGKPDDEWGTIVRVEKFTCANPASSNSKLAFRACITAKSEARCTSSTYRTSWW
ncbi:hypothetical protein FAF44_19850 [Nonomuraea sp. MG754425]|uniref:hypothetical protein n=1 Tax=Nonomuraea sp. MG754425 TaxID=2570319 RepID=UPI001F422F8A|nr:hypothetical protein [Nonomuraea sp. MG754425]MCF6470635.1 hypothetical protein [Nonomuraea sp. MG754425]